MKEVEKLFGSDFTVKVEGVSYNSMTVRQGDIKCTIVPTGKKDIKNKVFDGSLGSNEFLGEMFETQEYPAVGKLARVPVFVPVDGVLSVGEFPEKAGYVLIDNDGKIAHKNLGNLGTTLRDKSDATALIYTYGPSVLAFVEPSDFDNRMFKQIIEDTFRERIAELKKQGVPQDKLENEISLYQKAVDRISSMSLEEQNAKMQF